MRDPLDDPGLSALVRQLTSEATPDERSGEHAALTMFRYAQISAREEAREEARAAAPVVVRRPSHRRPPPARQPRPARPARRTRVGGRLVASGMVVAVIGGFAAAAYAEALPAPLQRAVHQIFAFAGVPNSPRSPVVGSDQGTTTRPTGTRRGHGGSASPGSSPRSRGSGSPSPHPSPSGRTSHSPHPSKSPHAGKSPHPGKPSPTPTPSPTAGPPVSLTAVPGKQRASLQVSAPLAHPGDVVELEVAKGGKWLVVRKHRLTKTEQTAFSVATRKISVTYRVVLLATAKHDQSVSNPVTVAGHHGSSSGKGGPSGKGQPGRQGVTG